LDTASIDSIPTGTMVKKLKRAFKPLSTNLKRLHWIHPDPEICLYYGLLSLFKASNLRKQSSSLLHTKLIRWGT
jgi:hypothetical protein